MAPRSIARAISSPVPRVVARPGSRRDAAIRSSPEARAISTTPNTPSSPGTRPNEASTGSPSGPVTRTVSTRAPAPLTTASIVPSPPSAIGTRSSRSPGRARRHPASIASAA